MKYFIGILLLTVISCSNKWQVVQKLDVNMYHLQNLKTKEVEIVISQDELKEGEILKKNKIKIIAEISK